MSNYNKQKDPVQTLLLENLLMTSVVSDQTDTLSKVIPYVDIFSLNKKDFYDNRPLISFTNNYDILNILLGNGLNADIQLNSNKETKLHMMVLENNLVVMELLLKNGANVNSVTQLGSTPLHYAKTDECLEILLKYNPDLSIKTKSGLTAKEYYKETGRPYLVQQIEHYEVRQELEEIKKKFKSRC